MEQTEETRAILERVGRIPIVATLNMQFEEFGEGTCKVKIPYHF